MGLLPGALSHRVRLERRTDQTDDGAGNVLAGWQPLGVVWVAFRAMGAREAIKAGRPQDAAGGVMTLRSSALTRGLTAADRAVFVTGPYRDWTVNFTSVTPRDAHEIEITIERDMP